jgi:hypothetical protein
MTADRDDSAGTGAVVRKPPKNEPAMGERVLVPRALSYVGLECRYNFGVMARILLNGEFAFCPIHDFNELSMTKIAHKQLWRDKPSRQSLNSIVTTDSY